MSENMKFDVKVGDALSMREIYDRYWNQFPVIIMVTQGYHGDTDMDTYPTGHVMRINSYSRQRRVIAKDNKGQYLSIPCSYPIKFRIPGSLKKFGKERKLSEIVDQARLPLQVELCLPPAGFSLHIGNKIKQIETFGLLELLETYEDTYLVANSIIGGSLDEEVLYVPLYLKDAVVAPVIGIRGKTKDEYQTFISKLTARSKRIKYDTTRGNPDIAVYSPESVLVVEDNMYDYIEPQQFIKYKPTRTRKFSVPLPNVQELLSKMEVNFPPEDSGGSRDSVPPLPERVALRKLSTDSGSSHVPIPSPGYVNDIGRAVVKPLTKDDPSQTKYSPRPTTPENSSSSPSSSTTQYVKGMSINDVIENLTVLNLDKYKDVFRDAQLSGDLLLELSTDNLKSDFNMKGFEAVKLVKFAKTGYVPK